jgi:hypothetical protein
MLLRGRNKSPTNNFIYIKNLSVYDKSCTTMRIFSFLSWRYFFLISLISWHQPSTILPPISLTTVDWLVNNSYSAELRHYFDLTDWMSSLLHGPAVHTYYVYLVSDWLNFRSTNCSRIPPISGKKSRIIWWRSFPHSGYGLCWILYQLLATFVFIVLHYKC